MRESQQIMYESYNKNQQMKSVKQPKVQAIQQQFFMDSLPGFINKLLSRFTCITPNAVSLRLGEIETRLYNMCYKGLKRDQFLSMLLAQVQKQMLKTQTNLSQNLQSNNSLSIHLLKTQCKLELFAWKIMNEIEIRNKSKSYIEDSIDEQYEKQIIKQFNKLLWRLRVQTQIEAAGSSETVIIEILTQFANLDRMPRNFKNRIRQLLIQNDFTPLQKYMRILGQQQHSQNNATEYKMRTPHKSHSGTPQKMQQILRTAKTQFISQTDTKNAYENAKDSANKKSTPNSITSSNLLMQAHKRIMKNKTAGLGRTLHTSHPMKYRMQIKKSTQENVYYMNGQHK